MIEYVVIRLTEVRRQKVEQNRAIIAVVKQVIATIARNAMTVSQFNQYSSTIADANNTGHNKNEVKTLETLRPATSFPHKICQGVIVVVKRRSSVCRSRSLVILPAEKTGRGISVSHLFEE